MPKQIRVNLIFDGASWRAPLHTYAMVPGSFQPVTALLMHADGVFPTAAPSAVLALNPSVLVEVPDADLPPPPFTNAQWQAVLDARYTEHAGKFSPLQR